MLLLLTAAGPVSLSAVCPKAKGDEIIVCADPEPRESPYRAPLRGGPPEAGTRAAMSVSRERNALFDYDAGGSVLCSNVGAGGIYGCAFKSFKAGVEQRANARDYRGRVYDADGK
ncbi:hypothetical protein KX816_08305 [Sphingosinicellaceae bacterium]|nr:hypothetical protein KX816_08305 [Sphingosinicellaceae bacterium]